MVIFLERYNNSLSHSNSEVFNNQLISAIYDFLEDRKEIGDYSQLKAKYSHIWSRLEKISKDFGIVKEGKKNGHETLEFIEECSRGKNKKFLKRLRPYLLPIMHSDSQPVEYETEN